MKPTLLILATLFCTTLVALPAVAGPEGPQSVPAWAGSQLPEREKTDAPTAHVQPPDPPQTPNPVPLDGGLGLLALAGAGYAANRLRKKR